jgi:peptide-methionine (S)-S-oxide reductase
VEETAILAGGCYWILQELLRDREGLVSTRAGWTGGRNEDPSEDDNDGHAEAVEVVFDPSRLSYRELLEQFFLVHRPDLDQGVVGSDYRSEIFYTSEEQQTVAAEVIAAVDASGHWPGPVATKVSEAGRFWAEGDEEQEWLKRYLKGGPAPPF